MAHHSAHTLERTESERAQLPHDVTIGVLCTVLDAHDGDTCRHSEAVVGLSVQVARQLGLAEDSVEEVRQVALLHDIGKIGIPEAILDKPGRLDNAEWAVMRMHPDIGAGIVASIDSLAHLAPAVRAVHERFDGGGYPEGLSGREIPLASRITFVCDAYHAMTSARPYRPTPLSANAAAAELHDNAGLQFDPDIVAALLRVLARYH
jgi:putative nucleotidyltransferase with HDIG domain